MSFGFSAGDLIQLIALVQDVLKLFERLTNAPKEVREVVDELKMLKSAIGTMEGYCNPRLSSNSESGLRTILSHCHATLKEMEDILQRCGVKRSTVAAGHYGRLGYASPFEAYAWDKMCLSQYIAKVHCYTLSLQHIIQQLDWASNGYNPQTFDPQTLDPHVLKVAMPLKATQLAAAWASGISMSLLFLSLCQTVVFLCHRVPSLRHILQTRCPSESAEPMDVTTVNLRLGLYLLSAAVYSVSLIFLYMDLSLDRGVGSFFCISVVIGLCFEGLIGFTAEQIWLVSMPLTVNFVLSLIFLWQRLRMHNINPRHARFDGKECGSKVGV